MRFRHVEKITHSLDLEEKLDHQIKGWRIQKACGILMLVIIVFTTLGLFGSGVLSSRTQKKEDTAVHFEKF